MLNSRIAGALLAAGVAIIGSGGVSHPPIVPERVYTKKQRRGLFNGKAYAAPLAIGHKGAGISMAQQQRASRKAKNVKRHRAACR